jgi:hypothetical protein
MVLVNSFVGVLAIKVIAERFDYNFRTLGVSGLFFIAITYLVMLLQHLGLDQVFKPMYPEAMGVSFMPWVAGVSCVLLLPFIYALSPWLVLTMIPLLYLSQSMVCVGVATIVFLVCLFRDSKPMALASGLLLIPLALWYAGYVDGGIDPNRFAVWKNALPHFKNWWFGYGLGSWAHSAFMHYNGQTPEYWRWAHNEFYQHLYEQGWVGLTLLSIWVVNLFYKGRKNLITLASLTGLLLISMVHPVMHLGKFLFLNCVILGIAEGNRNAS